MSNENKAPRSGRKQKSFLTVLSGIGKALAHNWGWKLVCLIAAVCMWSFLVASNKSLTRVKEFTNVTVSVSDDSMESLKRRGLVIVSGLEADKLSGFTLRANVALQDYQSVTAEQYNARVNLSTIRSAGLQKVDLIATPSNQTELSPSSIEVEVEEYITRSRIPVRISYIGTKSDLFYYPAASFDPEYISISGPKSLVNAVAACLVDFDRSTLPLTFETKKVAVTSFRLVNQEGGEIPRDMIRITPLSSAMTIDSIIVEQEMYRYQQLPISTEDVIIGEPAEGYAVKSITFTPAVVDVAPMNPDDDLTGIELYAASPIDISGIALTQDYRVDLSTPVLQKIKHMKTGITWMTVEIEPLEPQKPETTRVGETGAEEK